MYILVYILYNIKCLPIIDLSVSLLVWFETQSGQPAQPGDPALSPVLHPGPDLSPVTVHTVSRYIMHITLYLAKEAHI